MTHDDESTGSGWLRLSPARAVGAAVVPVVAVEAEAAVGAVAAAAEALEVAVAAARVVAAEVAGAAEFLGMPDLRRHGQRLRGLRRSSA
jgi:hypothetical protein